jgi:hypothetical protein
MKHISIRIRSLWLGLIATAVILTTSVAFGQGLNWEGQTGAFVTPFAYTSESPAKGAGHPQVAFHYLNGGNVVGNDFETSITEGLFGRVEFGYTRAFNAAGSSPALSPLFENGFNIFHGKVKFLDEGAFHTKFLPALAAGFVARTQVRRVGGVLTNSDTSNGDFYVVATKLITKSQTKLVPILLNFGVKETDASLLGIAGNAPYWRPRLFGAVGLVLSGPAKSTIVVGSEAAQQPHHIKDLPGATLPTTLTYFVRVIPSPKRPFNVDLGVLQAAGRVLPGANVDARAQFALGVSYRF